MIPIEVGNGSDVSDVIKDDVVLALACLGVICLLGKLRWTRMILISSEIEAIVDWLTVYSILLKDITSAALASIFCVLRRARRALILFVPDGAEVPEQQRVSA